MIPLAIRRLIAALCLTGAAIPFATGLPVRAETPAISLAQNGPAPCINLPLSSAELQPTSCWVTGPTSIIVAGVDAGNPSDGAVYVVDGQKKRRADLPGAGQLTITSVSGSMACVRDAAGRFSGINTTDAAATSGCGASPGAASTLGGGVMAAATSGPDAAPTAPPATTSYYVYGAYLAQCGPGTTTGCPLYNLGAGPNTSGLVILAFGAPCYNPNTLVYGTQLFNTQVWTPDDQLVQLAQAWIRGYESANPTRTTPTILGIGSSNSVTGADPPTYNLTPGQMYLAGYRWFGNVVKPVALGAAGQAAPLTVWAASDIEQSSPYPDGSPPDWYTAAVTRPWLDGYQAAAGTVVGTKCGATTPYQMVNFGDYVVPNKPGWSPADVYFLSWGAPLACALPEIYYAANAAEWKQLNDWATSQQLAPIQFTGVMSENGAGQPPSLSTTESWKALATATGQAPPYLTVIGYISTTTPFEAPTSVMAVPGGASAIVSWTAPRLGGAFRIRSYTITPYVGTTAQATTTVGGSAPPPVTGVVSGLTNGTTYSFTVKAVTSAGTGPESMLSNSVTPGDAFPYTAMTAQQYWLTGNDGATWVDVDPTNLTLTIKPQATATAVLSANADLWTANAGINQDLGIDVAGVAYPTLPGQPEAWKESGGYGGTYSPNAAFVRSTIVMQAGTTYTVKLKWKANKPQGAGVIFAGAGNGPYSPTRLTVQLLAPASVAGRVSNQQYSLPVSSTWVAMDSAALSLDYPTTATGTALISGNADLWTASAGYDQDIGIEVDGTVVAWKESGGFAGTYSPNAAFVQAAVPLAVAPHHQVSLVWKANKGWPANTVFAGAGPGAQFSPTTLSLRFLPASQVLDAVSSNQYVLASSDGSSWSAIDSGATLTITVNRTDNCLVTLTGNADLWTSVAGINQDLGITVAPVDAVTFPSNLVGWKESGGFAGTFSPNAAAVEAIFAMPAGTSYTATLVWKTNKGSAGAAYAGAGQAPYSPTRLTAVLTCQ